MDLQMNMWVIFHNWHTAKDTKGQTLIRVVYQWGIHCAFVFHYSGQLVGTGLMIERLRVQIPAGAAGKFSSQLCVLTLIRCLFHPSVTTMARKIPRSFYQKCRWQVTPKHAYTLDPLKSEWADYAAVQAQCGNLSGNELTRNLSGNTRSQLSQLAEPLWTDSGLKGGSTLLELIST